MKNKLLGSIKSFFCKNIRLKFYSVVIAFILWFVVATVDDPVDRKSFQNIRVNLVNTELLTENNQVYEVLENTDILKNVTFDAPKSVRDEIVASDIIAEADLEKLTVTNTVEIKFSCPKYAVQVQNISGNIDFVKLNIEDKASKWINIDYNLIGKEAEGYVIGKVQLNQKRIEISGPESVVNRVKKAQVNINVADITNDISTSVHIQLLDSEGKSVLNTNLNKSVDTVIAEVDVLSIKEVPVEILPIGEPAEGYMRTDVTGTWPERVTLAGETKMLNRITKLTVTVDVAGAQGSIEKNLDLKEFLADGVTFAEPGLDTKIGVRIDIEQIINKRVTMRNASIHIRNLPEGWEAEVAQDNASVIEVRGLKEYTDLVTESRLSGNVDVSEWMREKNIQTLSETVYELPVKVELLPQQEIITAPTARIELHKTEEE